jgi:hypothetical protein
VSFASPTHTKPFVRVAVKLLVIPLTEKDIDAFEAVLERGTYPIFLASDTTFSRSVAESKKDSLTIILLLNAVIYVLYASVSISTEKFDPSKSKSLNVELARR